ncbi:MAG: cadmium-translocating P-type ATPase [Clostridia bacterium]|nr:cadmium-translocating P-type ATPase [Clostridia bacterium]
MSKKQKKLLYRIIISLVLFIGAFILGKCADINGYIMIVIYLVPYFIAGYDVLTGCFKNILKGNFFDEQFLMSVATVGALIIGEYPESVFVMVFYQTGELFQSIAVGKSRKSISALMELCPDEAVVLRNGEEETVFSEEVEIGETVIVRPGEKIPVDGRITEGESSLDMKALTGESVPFDVYKGLEVKAGSINLTGIIKVEASKEFSDSTAAKILELVENSTLNKAKTEKFLTRFSRYYTPAVVIGAVLLAVIPSIITGDWKTWVYRALIFLVVSCPCALVISVPMSFFGGIGAASKKGILVKGANYLEALGKAGVFVFDKTGTLTTGEFSVSEILPEKGVSSDELLYLAASAEYYSVHPIAKGILKAAADIRIPDSVTEFSGFGVKAEIEGKTVLAGNRRFLEKNNVSVPGKIPDGTGVYVSADGKYAGFIRLSDTAKENAAEALHELAELGVKKSIMLTGDNEYQARDTAEKLGITQYEAGLLPDEKAEYVKKLCAGKNKGETVVFVGDGINDAPVLSLSDTGIAMGGVGSDAAIEAADVVIMDDNIGKCALAVKIAKKTRRIVLQNVIFALGIKFAVLIFAGLGMTNMWIGVFADVGVAVLAILNAMRAMRIK